MSKIELVKKLREMTSAGMMDCKKALEECNDDLDKAIDWLREKGVSKAVKKNDRIAAEGVTRVSCNGDYGMIFEINCETDFVIRNEKFLEIVNQIEQAILAAQPMTLEETLNVSVNGSTVENVLTEATATIGEKITFRRIDAIKKDATETFGAYVHMGGKISALALLNNSASEATAKDIAMHIAAIAPEFVQQSDINPEFIDKERSIQKEIMANDESMAGKPENVLAGILEGKVNKQLQSLCLYEQAFVKEPSQKVKEFLKSNNTEVVKFIRFAVGEGIEKKEVNFADEVMSQVKA